MEWSSKLTGFNESSLERRCCHLDSRVAVSYLLMSFFVICPLPCFFSPQYILIYLSQSVCTSLIRASLASSSCDTPSLANRSSPFTMSSFCLITRSLSSFRRQWSQLSFRRDSSSPRIWAQSSIRCLIELIPARLLVESFRSLSSALSFTLFLSTFAKSCLKITRSFSSFSLLDLIFGSLSSKYAQISEIE